MKNISAVIKQAIIVLALTAMVTMVAGCRNTAQGAGEDIERAGERIQDATR